VIAPNDCSSANAAVGEHLPLRQQYSELLTLEDSDR